MVNNSVVDWVKSELGNATAPYVELDETTSREVFEDYVEETALEEASKVILHGGPSEEESMTRYDLLETTAFYLQAKGSNPEIYIPDIFEDNVEESEVLHKDSVNFIQPEVTEDEITESCLENKNGSRIHITSDYHAEGVYNLNKAFDDNDFSVLTANTSREDFPTENYTSILGPLASTANKLGKLGVSWKTYAEGKELGRKMVDEFRGPRF